MKGEDVQGREVLAPGGEEDKLSDIVLSNQSA
jgi:hypothetical protein